MILKQNDIYKGRFWSSWPVLLLAGPVIWILHFWIVYLWAETACAAALPSDGGTSVAPLTAGVTVVAVAAIVAFGVRAAAKSKSIRARRSQDSSDTSDPHRVLYLVGACLAALSVLATVFVALPAMVLQPC